MMLSLSKKKMLVCSSVLVGLLVLLTLQPKLVERVKVVSYKLLHILYIIMSFLILFVTYTGTGTDFTVPHFVASMNTFCFTVTTI